MDSKQRVLTALNNEQPDKVPIFELYMNESSIVNLARLLASQAIEVVPTNSGIGEETLQILDFYCFVLEGLGLDATCSNFSIGLRRLRGEYVRDKYGTVYRLSDHGGLIPVEGAIKTASDIKGFDMASKLRLDDFARIQYIVNKVGKNLAHFVVIHDPFKMSWRLRAGMQNLLMDYMLNPQLVHDLARLSTDLDIAAIDLAIEIGADVIIMDGDLAGEKSMMISLQHYREYVKPYHVKIADYAHHKGIRIVKHSDGNVWPILDDLIEAGFDGIHPIQPQSMDIAEVKEHLTGKMCILGNIDCRNLLSFGTEEEVEEVVKETIGKAGPGGGYILSSSNSIHPGVKPENYIATVKAAHKYGIYK